MQQRRGRKLGGNVSGISKRCRQGRREDKVDVLLQNLRQRLRDWFYRSKERDSIEAVYLIFFFLTVVEQKVTEFGNEIQ